MDNEFISALEQELKAKGNPKIAEFQKAYLQGQFSFYGMKSPVRREVQKPFFVKQYLPPKENLNTIVKTLWKKPEREFHYFAQELAQKYNKELERKDIQLFEYMVIHNSWWDTVDVIATNLIGPYFKKFPDQINPITKNWLASDNIWLQRSCVIFQLKWKDNIDPIYLEQTINSLLGSKEFFINKAIGWILRQYSRTHPEWVIDFVSKTALSSLSRKEALRLLNA